MMSKFSIKTLALFLAMLTIMYLLPFSVFAENVANNAVNHGEKGGVTPKPLAPTKETAGCLPWFPPRVKD